MPEFRMLTVEDAQRQMESTVPGSAGGQYRDYLDQLVPGRAGCLMVAPEEKVGIVRTRLSAAARSAGKQIIIRRAGQLIFFWTSG
jgi:hypothetical protein